MCDFKQSYNQIDKMPRQLALEMQMPAHIRQRLEQSMEQAQAKINAKSLESKMRSAQENSSKATINKIMKAQAHNEIVQATLNRKRELLAGQTEVDPQTFEQWQPKYNALQNKLKYEERQQKAALRKDYQIANRIQNVQNL